MDMEQIRTGLRVCANGEPCIGEKFASCPFSPRNNSEPNCGVTMARACLVLLREQEPAWVSVKDRLPPKDDKKVLTYGDPVTHWMPLPEPPEVT